MMVFRQATSFSLYRCRTLDPYWHHTVSPASTNLIMHFSEKKNSSEICHCLKCQQIFFGLNDRNICKNHNIINNVSAILKNFLFIAFCETFASLGQWLIGCHGYVMQITACCHAVEFYKLMFDSSSAPLNE